MGLDMRNVGVAVLMGGMSAERQISIVSGEAVSSALTELGCRVTKIMVDNESFGGVSADNTDVAFIALHGGMGEDGTVQIRLENESIAYTGSGPDASKRAMNKITAKKMFEENGIPTPAYVEIDSHAAEDEIYSSAGELGYPVVVKPVSEGSTMGVTIVRDEKELSSAVEAALAYGGGVFLEAYVPGSEITVGVLGEQPLPVVEIRTARTFYDFEAKYKDEKTEYITDPDLPRHVLTETADAGLAAHSALGCRDVSRVDLRLTKEMEPSVLEVNTIPGMTRNSLLPKAAEAAGISYTELVERILSMALRRSSKC